MSAKARRAIGAAQVLPLSFTGSFTRGSGNSSTNDIVHFGRRLPKAGIVGITCTAAIHRITIVGIADKYFKA
jgi:hypothetical protein